jgi:hypothetical protein
VLTVVVVVGLLGIIDMRNKSEALFIVGLIVLASQALLEFYQHGLISPRDLSINRVRRVIHTCTHSLTPPTVNPCVRLLQMLLNAVLVAAAAAVMSLGIHAFTQKHLRFLDLALIWHGGEWHLGAVCWVASCMGGLAVLVPPLLQKTYSANFAALGYVPSSGESVVT